MKQKNNKLAKQTKNERRDADNRTEGKRGREGILAKGGPIDGNARKLFCW